MRRMRLSTFALAAVAFTQSGYTDCGQIIDDSGFDIWCGEKLCAWQVERGVIAKVPTWHRGDDGVELIGDDVSLMQMTDVNSADTACIRFEAIADIDETAQVVLDLDVFGDGTVEYSQTLPSAQWAAVSYRVRIDGPYNGVLFRLRKSGDGTATLAKIEAATADECSDDTIELAPRADGAWCNQPAECRSGICTPGFFTGICDACDGDDDCDGDMVCGAATRVPRLLERHRACVEPASHDVGDACAVAAECASGICCQGVCSTCCGEGDCAGGAACAEAERPADVGWAAPRLCAPGGGLAANGAACLVDADCASGGCAGAGTMAVCDLDGRRCDVDADCPRNAEGGDGRCVVVGTAGGSCE